MASSKNPSCFSQESTRPRNPNARNSEAIDPMRRSFSGSPFAKPSIMACQRGGCFNPNTPANSPSDCPQRKSISRESLIAALIDYEDKENGKDHNWKQARVRSPSTKNFMSLTTSAASKINASPRKKVLNERNEPICTSFSVSDVKSPSVEDLGSKAEKGLNQKKGVSFDLTVTYLGEMEVPKSDEDEALKNDEDIGSFSDVIVRDDSEDATLEKDSVNLDPSFKISPKALHSLPSPALAPLDADPSMPPYDDGDTTMLPYDPKTNYLSPRPQFLHYRPNPRIELYLNKERDGVQLEESFVSLSSSDAENTEDDSQSVGSQREFEDASLSDGVKQEEEKAVVEEDKTLPMSELNNNSTSEGVNLNEEKNVSKSHFFRRTKLLAVLPVLAVAFLLVLLANPSVMDSSVLNNLSSSTLYVPPEISEFTRESLGVVAQQFKQQLDHLLSFANYLVASFRERPKLGSSQYNNLSISLNDGLIDSDLVFDYTTLGSQEKYENYVSGPMKEGDGVDLEKEELQSKEAEEKVEIYTEYEHEQVEEQSDIAGNVEDVEIVAEDSLGFPMEFGVSEPEEVNLDPEFEVIRSGNSAAEAMEERIEAGDYNIELQSETYDEEQSDIVGNVEDVEIVAEDSLGFPMEFGVSEPEEVDPEYEVIRSGNSAAEATEERIEAGDYNVELQSETYDEDEAIPIPEASKTEQGLFDAGDYSVELQSETYVEDGPIPIPEASKTEHRFFDAGQPQGEADVNHAEPGYRSAGKVPESLYLDAALTNPQNTQTGNLALYGVEDAFSAKLILPISLLALGLLAATAFICRRNQKILARNADSAVAQLPHHNTKINESPVLVSAEHTFLDTKADMVGDSCPSEMSSFRSSSSYINRGPMETSEVQSGQRKSRKSNRRESLASSDYSTGSPSYGSFTTYEKISSKHGSREEEVITPVRRSSRIRMQVTSP